MSEIIRVLRIIEYIGKREWVESTVARSIHGTKVIENRGEIRAATIGAYPEILTRYDQENNEHENVAIYTNRNPT